MYKLSGKQFSTERSTFEYKGKKIGGSQIMIIAGSCAVESEEQIMLTAQAVSKLGVTFLRGGAFKPRTSPYDFQGLGEDGLIYLQKAAKQYDMLSVSEVMDSQDIDLVGNYVDVLQVGSRNMQNYALLKKLGSVKNPILLKRGFCATYHEFLLAAEYILSAGNPNVILCERGIRTFEPYTRNTLDIAAVPVLQALSHLPVIVDPSHGIGIRQLVPAMARAAVAAGADGLIIETHPDPDNALTDAQQTISPAMLEDILLSLRPIATSMQRTL